MSTEKRSSIKALERELHDVKISLAHHLDLQRVQETSLQQTRNDVAEDKRNIADIESAIKDLIELGPEEIDVH